MPNTEVANDKPADVLGAAVVKMRQERIRSLVIATNTAPPSLSYVLIGLGLELFSAICVIGTIVITVKELL